MSPSRVSISAKSARALRDFEAQAFDAVGGFKWPYAVGEAFSELRAALKPKPRKPWATSRKVKREKQASKREETAAIRREVFARAADKGVPGFPMCELCGARKATDLHHAFGKGKVQQTVRNCLAACRACHEEVGHGDAPAAERWAAVARAFAFLGFIDSHAEAVKHQDYHTAKAALSDPKKFSSEGAVS